MWNGVLSVVGRACMVLIFLMSAVGNKIPNFQMVAGYMEGVGVPMPQVSLLIAIVMLIVGSLSVLTGYYVKIGAGLLVVFLALATYFFHGFWRLADPQAQQMEMIQAMKNLSIAGAMLFLIANGPGAWSLGKRPSE